MQATTVNTQQGYRLYSIPAIVLATFFGSPVAGGVLMAFNYNRLGHQRAARNAIFIGISMTFSLFFISWAIEQSTGVDLYGLTVAGIGLMYFLAKQKQERPIKNHLDYGGAGESLWKATGIGLFTLPLVMGFLLVLMVVLEQFGIRL